MKLYVCTCQDTLYNNGIIYFLNSQGSLHVYCLHNLILRLKMAYISNQYKVDFRKLHVYFHQIITIRKYSLRTIL